MAVKTPQFGSVTQPALDLNEGIRELKSSLAYIEEVQAMSEHPGWKHVQEMLLDLVAQADSAIVAHCHQPDKHRDYLIRLSALRESYMTLVDLVQAPAEQKEGLIARLYKRLNILEGTSSQPRASEMDITHPMADGPPERNEHV